MLPVAVSQPVKSMQCVLLQSGILCLSIHDSVFFVYEMELHSSSNINEYHDRQMCHINFTYVNTSRHYNSFCLNGFGGKGFSYTSKYT